MPGVTERINKAVRSPRALLVLSGLLTGLTFIIRGSEWLIFVSLLPLIYYVYKAKKRTSKQYALDFYMFGFIVCGFGNLFLFDLDPNNWSVQISGIFALFATALAWVLICSFCSLSFMALGYGLSKISLNKYKLLALPILFALAELIKSYLFAVMAYGPHGSLSPNFNWGSIAVTASGTPLVYASRFVGFFGLTALVVAINVCIYLLISRRQKFIPLAVIFLVTLVTVLGQHRGDSRARGLNAAAVHLGPEQSLESWDKSKWPTKDTDLLVLPEYSEFLKNPNYKQILSRLSKDGIAITTIRNGTSPHGTNRLLFINRQGKIVDQQDKTFMIPTGETMPYSLKAGFRLIRKRDIIDEFTYIQQVTNGSAPEHVFVQGNLKVGALACSGVSALSEYHRLSGQGADVLVNSASLAFLKPNSHYHIYARNMARFQAVSNNKPFVQSSRSGRSYIIDRQGNFLHHSSSQQLTTLITNKL